MGNVYKVANLKITTPSDWLDVTEEIEEDSPPFSLAKPDGVGAIQFSVARYKGGRKPDITFINLQHLLADFAQSRELGRGYDVLNQENPFLVSAASFNDDSRFWRVWYCSDGQSVALVTYNCKYGVQQTELSDCERVVLNLKFEN